MVLLLRHRRSIQSSQLSLAQLGAGSRSSLRSAAGVNGHTGTLQKVKSGKGRPDWHVSVIDSHHRSTLLWVYGLCCPGHADPSRVKENDRADRLARKATITSGMRLGMVLSVEELETLSAGAKKCKGHHIRLRREERRRKEETIEKEPSSIRRTLKLFQRQCLGKLSTAVAERIWAFPSA